MNFNNCENEKFSEIGEIRDLAYIIQEIIAQLESDSIIWGKAPHFSSKEKDLKNKNYKNNNNKDDKPKEEDGSE